MGNGGDGRARGGGRRRGGGANRRPPRAGRGPAGGGGRGGGVIGIRLVDDPALVREGVSRLLEAQPDMTVIGSFGEGKDAVRFAAREEPDVAILDIAMPTASGVDVARQLR